MKTAAILLFFIGLAFCYWDPLLHLRQSPDFLPQHVDHHKGKTPCHIPEKFVTHVSKTYLDKDGCPTSYHLGIFLYDFPNQRIRFDEVSYYNASKNSTHWIDYNLGKGFSYNHISKKCYSKDLKGKTLPRMELKNAKFHETLLLGAEQIDLWYVEKSHNGEKMNAIVGVTEGTCFVTNVFAFKISSHDSKHKDFTPIASAVMWNFVPTVPLYQFSLPDACQKAEATNMELPFEDIELSF